MSERDWKEEQRGVLARLFEAAFERREVPEKEIKSDVHWLGTVNNPPPTRRLIAEPMRRRWSILPDGGA